MKHSSAAFAALFSVLVLFLAHPASAQTRSQFPIGYVSVQKVLSEAEDAKEAAKQIETLRQAKTVDLAARRQALDQTRLQIANAGGYFSSSRREQLKAQEKRQEAELQQAQQQAQTELTELGRKVQESLRGELGKIVTAIAAERGFSYVLSSDSAVLVAPSGTDLTKEVLDRFNASSAQRAAAEKALAEKAAAEKK
jgi:Skp family chaperone for outer membrane proteins